MISFPNAKINLGLHITKKREDGYHNIESCFYPIDWCDILEIIPNQEKLSFESTGITIPNENDSDNLCIQAYKLLQKDFNIPPVLIHLHKIIPIGAGLGGGSSDAAFTLKMLNEIYKLNLSIKTLEEYAAQLGSDCAFFIQNKPLIATEKGDTLNDCSLDLKSKHIVLIYPNKHISTKEAYANITPKASSYDINKIHLANFSEWKAQLKNDFETSLNKNYSYIEKTKATFYNAGALYASLSGSGSTVYGIFDNEIDTQGLFDKSWIVQKAILS